MSRRRWRTAVLWVGCTLCVLIAVVFVLSAWWEVVIQIPPSRGPATHVVAGSVGIVPETVWSVPVSILPHGYNLSRWNSWDGPVPPPRYAGFPFLEFPIYAVFAIVVIPTLLVWRFAPKFPSGHCRRCGYNLTGLRAARCPECGAGFAPRGRAT